MITVVSSGTILCEIGAKLRIPKIRLLCRFFKRIRLLQMSVLSKVFGRNIYYFIACGFFGNMFPSLVNVGFIQSIRSSL